MQNSEKIGFKPDTRRSRRALRQRLHPQRARISEREAFLEKTLETALRKLRETSRAPQPRPEEGAAALREQLLRARAEFDNFRKRVQREKEELEKIAAQKFITALLPALDSFDQAIAALEQNHDAQALAQGVLAIHQQMHQALAAEGVETIAPRGHAFDPHLHEALAVEKTAEFPENTVMDVFQNGYRLNNRLLRPARVRIAQKP